MSGECDKCGEHCLDCECKKKSFEQLVEEKSGCFEFAWNGFIRMYEEGEKRCECKDCEAMDKLKSVTPPLKLDRTPLRKIADEMNFYKRFNRNGPWNHVSVKRVMK